MLLVLAISLIVPALLALFGLGFVATLFIKQKQMADARSAAMEKVAQALGLTFAAQDPYGLPTQLRGFELFSRERTRWINKGKVSNVMRGLIGDTDVYLFDYSYTVSSGKSRKTISQTVFFANNKNWFLPNFTLKPEHWWNKLMARLGLDSDINFSENPDFSEKFWLKSEFEGIVREQFTPALQRFLAQIPPVYLEGSNYYLIGYIPRVPLHPNDARLLYQHCLEIVHLLQEKGKLELLELADIKKEAIKLSPPS